MIIRYVQFWNDGIHRMAFSIFNLMNVHYANFTAGQLNIGIAHNSSQLATTKHIFLHMSASDPHRVVAMHHTNDGVGRLHSLICCENSTMTTTKHRTIDDGVVFRDVHTGRTIDVTLVAATKHTFFDISCIV